MRDEPGSIPPSLRRLAAAARRVRRARLRAFGAALPQPAPPPARPPPRTGGGRPRPAA
jgi:hypothetical protein